MPHYFSEKQVSDPKEKKIWIHLKKISFSINTSSGVFSKDKLDKGSELLINYCEPKGRVFDIGCGYGVVGIGVKLLHPGINVVMSDVNDRALALAKKNILQHNLTIKIIKSNLFENITEKFDTILTNPPQSAGKDICFKIIEDSHEHLNEGGSLQLVARHNKGGKQLMQKMKEIFGNVSVVKRGGGFRIYRSKLEF